MYAGGGAGRSPNAQPAAGSGAPGGGGFYNFPVTQPFSQPYSVGAGGNAPGGTGGNTTLANVGTVNGGTTNTAGNQPGSNLTVPVPFRGGPTGTTSFGFPTAVYSGFGSGGQGSGYMEGASTSSPGLPGAIIVFENTGT